MCLNVESKCAQCRQMAGQLTGVEWKIISFPQNCSGEVQSGIEIHLWVFKGIWVTFHHWCLDYWYRIYSNTISLKMYHQNQKWRFYKSILECTHLHSRHQLWKSIETYRPDINQALINLVSIGLTIWRGRLRGEHLSARQSSYWNQG